ncbi:MAG: carboxypeptidase regulatory-like domain-containing protein, partial [Gemmatimonadota bacterium]|nr:carboxypeptidase regulatory-like domain-containing protein [Gemmatimonadota bacterium]
GDERFLGRVVGRVGDRATGLPVAGARIALAGEDREALSDGNGRYAFESLVPGLYRLAVRHLNYEPVEQIVEIPGNRTLEVSFELSADPIELEPLVVTAVRERKLEVQGFYERREISEKVGNGVFFDQEAIRQLAPTKVTQVLNYVPGVRVDCSGGFRAGDCRVLMTGGQPSLNRSAQTGCENANVYVDGVRVVRENQTMPMSVDQLVLPSEIAGMEVYRSPSEVPAEFGGSVGRCGAIVIWTGSGG